MPQISRLSIARARLEPEAVFDHPAQLLAEVLLTRGQKIAALRRWRQFLDDRIRAAGEGMQPSDPAEILRDMATLEAVIEAESRLPTTKAA
ncbi:MAG: hypothetical protein AB7E81_22285 [Hyphomicrobiaceae bacterium]